MIGDANGTDLRANSERTRQEQLILSERAREQGLNARATALQLAVQVAHATGDPNAVLSAAHLFADFLLDTAPAEGTRQ